MVKSNDSFKPAGVIPALATPLTHDMRVNEKALRKLIQFVIKGGVHGINPVGTTGEFYGLTVDQKRQVLEITLDEVGGKIPVYFGAAAITTRECIELAQLAEKCGADAVSVLTPFFVSPQQTEIYLHYKMIAENTGLPVVMYNNFPKTHVNITAETVAMLADIKNIAAIKDSNGDFSLTEAYIQETRGKDFAVIVGRDNFILPGLEKGAVGAISSNCNVAPRVCAEIYNRFVEGDLKGALEAQEKLVKIRGMLTLGTFPAPIKEALEMIGIDAGPCFLPAGPLTPEERNKLRNILIEANII